jgi:uncharacterized protein YndB with AHSA1/START domain
MKTSLLLALTVGLALVSTHLQAQSSATTATPAAAAPTGPGNDFRSRVAQQREEITGTIQDVTPGRSLVLHTGTNAGEPLHLRFADEVTYFDSDGKRLEAAGLRKNLRVRVSYVKQGGDNIVDRVTLLQ